MRKSVSISNALGATISAPGFIHSPLTYAYFDGSVPAVAANDITSLSLTRVSISSTTVTVVSCGYSSLTYSRKLSNDFFPLPFTLSVSSSGHVAINASRLVFPITPGPYIAPVLAPFGARCLNPTPGIAPVL